MIFCQSNNGAVQGVTINCAGTAAHRGAFSLSPGNENLSRRAAVPA